MFLTFLVLHELFVLSGYVYHSLLHAVDQNVHDPIHLKPKHNHEKYMRNI